MPQLGEKYRVMDRRIVRTRRLLTDALLELTNEKPYETITIRDITDRADIGYATFFRHYAGKDELMLEIFTKLVAELESTSESHQADYFQQEGFHFFQHVDDNSAVYQSILDSLQFTRILQKHLIGIVEKHLTDHASDIPDPAIPHDVAAQHVVASLLGLTDWWLRQNKPYSVEEMAHFYERLIIHATWHVMNASNPIILPWE